MTHCCGMENGGAHVSTPVATADFSWKLKPLPAVQEVCNALVNTRRSEIA